MNYSPPPADESTFVLKTEEQVRAFAHPLRQRILDVLATEELTNKQIAEAVGKPPGNTHHHVTTLERAGLITQTRSRKYRGVVERYYRTVAQRFALASPADGDSQKFTVTALLAASERLADQAVEDGTGIVRIVSETRWMTDNDMQRLDKLLGELRKLMTSTSPDQTGSGHRVAILTVAQELASDRPREPGADDE